MNYLGFAAGAGVLGGKSDLYTEWKHLGQRMSCSLCPGALGHIVIDSTAHLDVAVGGGQHGALSGGWISPRFPLMP